MPPPADRHRFRRTSAEVCFAMSLPRAANGTRVPPRVWCADHEELQFAGRLFGGAFRDGIHEFTILQIPKRSIADIADALCR